MQNRAFMLLTLQCYWCMCFIAMWLTALWNWTWEQNLVYAGW